MKYCCNSCRPNICQASCSNNYHCNHFNNCLNYNCQNHCCRPHCYLFGLSSTIVPPSSSSNNAFVSIDNGNAFTLALTPDGPKKVSLHNVLANKNFTLSNGSATVLSGGLYRISYKADITSPINTTLSINLSTDISGIIPPSVATSTLVENQTTNISNSTLTYLATGATLSLNFDVKDNVVLNVPPNAIGLELVKLSHGKLK
jgi:hypothetical protein